MNAVATGIGSMPGTDMAEALRIVTGELPDLVHLPELPARGVTAGMIGRATALLDGLPVDLQPAGWRLADASGVDHRRAVATLRRDLDDFEEHAQGYSGRLKVQVTGPWTLAAMVERPRGDKVLADHGARRELAQSLAQGVAGHVAELARRVPGAAVLVQVDEPALPAVLAGAISTASGFHRHRSVNDAAAIEALRWVVDGLENAGAVPVLHTCAADVPVALLVRSGFRALSFDLSHVRPTDDWAAALDAGTDLWPGVVPTIDPGAPVSDAELTRRVDRFVASVGFEPETMAYRLVVTPTCGLAGASPSWTRRALALARTVAAQVGRPT